MGARSTGLLSRRAYGFDAATVLVGAVKAGTRGRAAETRTGAAQLLTTRLDAQDVFKIVVNGNASAAGQYTIQAAHVAEGAALASASTYATLAVVTCAPGMQEIPISGVNARELVRAAGSVTGEVCVRAVRAVAGADANAPAGVNTIRIVPMNG
jgi:hypothetical protein